MSQYTIIYKNGKRTRQLKFKWSNNIFPRETVAAGESRFAPELNEKEVIELLQDLPISWGVLNKTIIPLALVGYEMI